MNNKNIKFEKYSIANGLNKLKSYNFNVIPINDILDDTNISIIGNTLSTTSYYNLVTSLRFVLDKLDDELEIFPQKKIVNYIEIKREIEKFLSDNYNSNQILDRGVLTLLFTYINKIAFFTPREVFIKNFGYWIINQQNVNNLKEFIGNSKVLEIMAGTGYVGNILAMNGIDIISTDDGSWNNTFNKIYRRDESIDCIKAIEKYGKECDVLLISWVPYMENIGAKAMSLYHEINPNGAIIWIGEPAGGCCGDDEDFEVMEKIGRSKELEDIFNHNFEQFMYINDEAYIMDPTGKRTMTKYIAVDDNIEK